MTSINLDILWNSLLKLKEDIRSLGDDFETAVIALNRRKANVSINDPDQRFPIGSKIVVSRENDIEVNGDHALFVLDNLSHVTLKENSFLRDQTLIFLEIYLPYCFVSLRARSEKRAFAVSHFAQSLDGRIAASNGSSQWIGNDENLIHAHRMRSLCDAVLIGSRTLTRDKPALTVRHVEGSNPVKVVVGDKDYDFNSLLKTGGEVLALSSSGSQKSPEITGIRISNKKGILDCREILERLFEKGINSVYIEGGGLTTSHFLNSKAIDVIQLHIAPMIMGSGIAGFTLPQIRGIDESVRFSDVHFFPQGNHVLFSGTVSY
jgi:diaminohydroxyphosphoribosylaminopyrimidine deaminase/5-amino-6-(5-phosphoribosylamino)uracil reductase